MLRFSDEAVDISLFFLSVWYSSSYLARRHELQRPQGTAHVGNVGLQLIEGGCDLGLDLGGLGPRRAVGRDLVQCLLRHDAGDIRRCCVEDTHCTLSTWIFSKAMRNWAWWAVASALAAGGADEEEGVEAARWPLPGRIDSRLREIDSVNTALCCPPASSSSPSLISTLLPLQRHSLTRDRHTSAPAADASSRANRSSYHRSISSMQSAVGECRA